MKVEKIGDNLAVVFPADVAETLGLHEGDAVSLYRDASAAADAPGAMDRLHALALLRSLGRPLPSGFRFDRDEANAR